MRTPGDIWIQGAGEMASGVAVCLIRAGYRVLLAEIESPLAVRRLACFAEAVYAGSAEVAGIPGRLLDGPRASFAAGRAGVVVDPRGLGIAAAAPAAIIDARLTKRTPRPLPAAGVPRIGLGPGFTCGVDADLVVETHRETGPGRVISAGSAAPDTGIPGAVGGQTLARVLRAPAAGRLRPACAIGDLVVAGQMVGEVAGQPVTTVLDGLLRGLVHERAELQAGTKVGDVDPRGAAVDPRDVTDKALAIGAGVVAALARLGVAAG